jgi:CheY-like chemotaxis protein
MKILLAEDDKVCQNAIKTFSKKYGIECHVANNGVEAYEYCKANNDYSVILMDLGMEPMDGYQATKEIRSLSYGSNFNIIALSGGMLIS